MANPEAILNGSIVVTAWVQVGTLWQSSGQPRINSRCGACQVGFPGCAYPQDLYLNDAMLTHVTSPANLTTGTWYFDYVNDMVWMGDDPTGQTVELSVTPQAFVADADNIMIQNLTIEKYASFQQQGAVDVHGNGCRVSNDEIRLNHAEGVRAYALNDQILSNNLHDNGESGCGSGGTAGPGDANLVVEGNIINHNNIAHTSYCFESGGCKFGVTNGVTATNNTVTNNDGIGLWADMGLNNGNFSGNTVTDNSGQGVG